MTDTVSWGKDKPTLSTKVSVSTFQEAADGDHQPQKVKSPTPPIPDSHSLQGLRHQWGSFIFCFKDCFWGTCLCLYWIWYTLLCLHFAFLIQGMWDLAQSRTEISLTALEGKVLATQPVGEVLQEVLKDTLFEESNRWNAHFFLLKYITPFSWLQPCSFRDSILASSFHMISKSWPLQNNKHTILEFCFFVNETEKGSPAPNWPEPAVKEEAQRKEELA